MHIPCVSSSQPNTCKFASVQRPKSALSVHGIQMCANVHTTDKVDVTPTSSISTVPFTITYFLLNLGNYATAHRTPRGLHLSRHMELSARQRTIASYQSDNSSLSSFPGYLYS